MKFKILIIDDDNLVGLSLNKVLTKLGYDVQVCMQAEEALDKIVMQCNAKKGDLILFVADKESATNTILGQLRIELGKRLKLIDNTNLGFLWIVDFPLFELDSEQRKKGRYYYTE